MPHKHTIRRYFSGGYYHIYNRGVEKRDIFLDQNDYNTFLSLVECYLAPKEPIGSQERLDDPTSWRSKLSKNEIEMICFVFMPNHFHFILKQNSINAVTKFMRRIMNAYVKYFNKKYDRVGVLFQGKFKAALIENDSYLLHLTRYIHLNHLELEVGPLNRWKNRLKRYAYSSYLDYVGLRKTSWLKPEIVLNFFKNSLKEKQEFKNVATYQAFVENYKESEIQKLGSLTLD